MTTLTALHRARVYARHDACRRNCAAIQPDGWMSGEDRHMPHWVCPSCRQPQVTPIQLMLAAFGHVHNWHPSVIRAMGYLTMVPSIKTIHSSGTFQIHGHLEQITIETEDGFLYGVR